jgi:DNA-binding transcriptional ArsR family regulator
MDLQERAKVFKALGHPARLAMVERIGKGECCVHVLKEFPDLPQLSGPTISQHLLVLKNAGIITDEKRGQRIFYRLRMPCVTEISLCVKERESV